MIERTLDQIASATGGSIVPGAGPAAGSGPGIAAGIDAVGTDSRQLPPGRALFVALRGEHADGHRFARDAAAAGAVAILAEISAMDNHLGDIDIPIVAVDDTWQALRDLAGDVRTTVDPTAVAITGSVGKTTVKDLAAAAVAAGHRTHAARGSYNNELGVPLTLLGIEHDTEVVIAEIGARHVGDIADLAPLVAPDVAVVTSVAAVHLEIFGSVDAVARAKGELVAALGSGGTAILNADDPRVAAMAERAPATITVGLDTPSADVRARDVTLDHLARPRAVAVTPWGEAELRLPVAGRHHVTNALLAIAAAGHLGVDLSRAAEAIADAPVSPWRGEVVDAGGVRVLNDAYNANPTSVVAALDTLAAIDRSGRTWAVLGVMAEIGDTADAEHHAVGARAAAVGIDRLVVVGAHASGIARGALASGATPSDVVEVADAAAALEVVRREVEAGDVVLVKASRVGGLEAVAAGLIGSRSPQEVRR